MGDESSSFSSVAKWVGGILAALLIFAGEQYIQHHWPDTSKSQQSDNSTQNTGTTNKSHDADHETHPSPAHVILPVAGRVVDAAGTKAIENAVVHLTIGVIHEDESTDTEGRYAFSLEDFDPQTAASMTVEAPGYKHLSMNLLLKAMAEDNELKLVADQPSAAGHAGLGAIVGATWVGAAHPGASGTTTGNSAMVNYVRRVNPKLIVAQK